MVRCTCRGTEAMDVKTVGQVMSDLDPVVKMTGPVRATGVTVGDGQITLSLEADVVVELSALSRMWIKAYDLESDIFFDMDDRSDASGSGSGSGSSSSSSSSSSSGSSGE